MSKFNKNIDTPIGVAIAGLGFGESVHLEALNSNSQFNTRALWHPNNERLEESSQKHSIYGYTNWDELLDNKNIQALIIATPPEPRFELAKKALKAGKHLLLEKPVCLTSEQIKELQRIAVTNKLSVAVDFEYRAVPFFMQTKKIISKGTIGTPWFIKLDWLMSSRADTSRPWNWYSDQTQGGGVLGALGTHAFDMIHWLFGPTQSISGQLSTSIAERYDRKEGESKTVTSEDIALAQLEIIDLNSTYNSVIPAQINLSAVSRHGRGCWLEVYGSNGTLLLGSNNQKDYVHGFDLWLSTEGDDIKKIAPDKEYIFKKTWADGRIAPVSRLQNWWAKSIISGRPMIPGLTEGLLSQRACEATKESSSMRHRISIDL